MKTLTTTTYDERTIDERYCYTDSALAMAMVDTFRELGYWVRLTVENGIYELELSYH